MMKNFIKLKSAASSKDQGFITLEILIAILIAIGFLAVAMQSLVSAMAIKIQAQEKQRASQLIAEDLETANEFANRSDLVGSCDPTDYNSGYAKGLFTQLENKDKNPTKSLLSEGGGRQLALERTEVSAATDNSDAPHRTLKIKYQVWWGWTGGNNYLDKDGTAKTNADEPIAETYVEIIPDVALACP